MIILTSPGEIAFKIGNLQIYYYGLCLAMAAVCGFLLSYVIAKKDYKDFDTDILFDTASISIFSGIIFARLYYCLLNFNYYSNHIYEIFDFRQGGLSIHGALLGGIIVTTIYCQIKKYPTLKIADIMSYGLIFAQAIGRWGNFFNSEAYGFPSHHIIAQFIPESARISGYEFYKYFHPTFLYESILDILVLLILYFIVRNDEYKFDGYIFAFYLILYSIIRFFVEALRLDSIVNVGALHVPQFVSLVIIFIASAAILFVRIRNSKKL